MPSIRSTLLRASLASLPVAAVVLAACASEGVVGSLAKEPPDAGASSAEPPDGGVDDGALAEPIARTTTALAAGGESTCVRTKSGEVKCWGENASGSLGIGDTEPASIAEPVAPTPLAKMQAVAGGERSQCAVSAAGKVFCWGDIFIGDFNGQPTDHLPAASPFPVEGVGDVSRLAVGRYFTCLLGSAGDLRCFGLNGKGQLGVGDTEKRYLPTTVTGFDGAVTSISASMGGLYACATTRPGSVYCWGDNTDGQISSDEGPVTSPRKLQRLPERAVEVVAGRAHACARLVSGSVKCWGANDRGQLGNGKKTASSVPVEAMYLTEVTSLAAGRDHTCAIRREGTLFCWGDDTAGQAGGTPDGSRPSLVKNAAFGAAFVSCGLAHSCAWGAGGNVECWGSDSRSQLGPVKATF